MAAKKKSGKKPKGWRAFDRLARQIASVPKEEVDRLEQKRTKRRSKTNDDCKDD